MSDLTEVTVFWLIGLVGSTSGVVLNLVLLFVLLKRWPKYAFSFLFATTACFDLFFAVTEIFTQHQIAVKNGVMFVLSAHSIEWLLRPYYLVMMLVLCVHFFGCMHQLLILAALYQYHFEYVRKRFRTPDKIILFRNLAISCTGGLIIAIAATIGIDEAMERGRKHYIDMFDDEYFQANAKNFLYAADIRDGATMLFFGLDLLFVTISIAATAYYAFRARLSSIDNEDEWTRNANDPHANKIPFARSQFTRILSARTIITWVVLIPLLMVVTALIFRLNIELLGGGVMAPWSFIPALNAATTLFVLRNND
ncbi:hypothetical protein M3Y99_00663600 [Aphelenchoides fujianensis]|nr:hypothetical protein M3Y99_00663600 [Aphelenchoides fujianensis]